MMSSKPRKQRFFRYNADMHLRQHFVNAHIDKQLQQKLGIKKRSIQISKGDTVKVMAGSSKGKTGKVTKVDMRKNTLLIDSVKKKNARGKEYYIQISTSNVYITDLNLNDKRRAAKLHVKPTEKIQESKSEGAKAQSVSSTKVQEHKQTGTKQQKSTVSDVQTDHNLPEKSNAHPIVQENGV